MSKNKNKTEIRAFTRQMNEEGRVKYSIDQWYHAEEALREIHHRFGTNSNLWPEGYREMSNDERSFSIIDRKTGSFTMGAKDFLLELANKLVSGGSTYDSNKGSYTYYDKNYGWDNALYYMNRMEENIKIVFV